MKSFLLSLILFFLIVGTNNSFAQTAAEYYFPLNVGNNWNYYTPGSPGSQPNGWAPRTVLETIDGTDLIAGQQFYRIKGVEICDQNPWDTITYHVLWVRKDFSGNILVGAFSPNSTNIDSAIIINPPIPLFQNEFLNAGYSREFFFPISNRYHQDSVISTTETVIVPAGTFTNCLKIRERNRDTNGVVTLLEYVFYAHNIGEVMRIREIPVSQVHTNSLIQYSVVTSVEARESDSSKFSLCQNYPNPFNPATTISFTLPSRSFVSLKVSDGLGREVATIVSGEMSAGSYSKQWDASGLPSGVYFYRLQAGSFTETKKLILLR